MCGIAGIYGPSASEGPVKAMLDLMEHRGPDGSGLFASEGIVLGHRRLAIVDLSEQGRQPMVSMDGQIAISVNGEIYNYRELRAELEHLGYRFRSDCDSEVVIHGWRAWGPESLSRYNGMFAIALYDGNDKSLHLVRDRMGIKPLYLWQDGSDIFFASDMRAIVAGSGRSEWAISSEGLREYLTYQNRFGQTTLLDGIRMIKPGEHLEAKTGKILSTQYSDPLETSGILYSQFDEAAHQFQKTFDSAVRRHLMSDVPLASYLSSGIDSSLVAATAAMQLGGTGPDVFTGVFDKGGWYDEGTGAEATAAMYGLTHHRVVIDASKFEKSFDALVYALDEPRMGTGSLPQYLVAEQVARSHKVVLTGHGGDELFSGYPVFKFLGILRRLRENPFGALRLIGSVRSSEIPHIVYFALSALRRNVERPLLPVLFGDRLRKQLLRKEVTQALAKAGDRRPKRGKMSLQTLLDHYIRDYLPGLLVVEDKVSMAHSLESRTPFLDNELVRLSLQISPDIKLDKGTLKAIPKHLAHSRLPNQLFALPKRGFPNPLGAWLRGPLAGWMVKRLCTPGGALAVLFETGEIAKLVETYRKSWTRRVRPLDEIATHRIFMLLSLESFIRQYQEKLGVRLKAPSDKATLHASAS